MEYGLSCGDSSEYPTPSVQVPRCAFECLSQLEHAVIWWLLLFGWVCLFVFYIHGLPCGCLFNVH